MRARSWLLLAAGAAVATAAGRAALRAGRAGELTTGADEQAVTAGPEELTGRILPAIHQEGGHRGDRRLDLRQSLRRFSDQARDFVRIVSAESTAKESELRARLGLDDQPTDRSTGESPRER